MREADPRVTAATMARIIGVSRERVRQVLVEEGKPTTVRTIYDPLCERCGRPVSRHRKKKLCRSGSK